MIKVCIQPLKEVAHVVVVIDGEDVPWSHLILQPWHLVLSARAQHQVVVVDHRCATTRLNHQILPRPDK